MKLSDEQRRGLAALNERHDGALLATRIWPAAKANEQLAQVMKDTLSEIPNILTPQQHQRVQQIRIRICGVRAIQDADVAERLQLANGQRTRVDKILLDSRRAVEKLYQKAKEGGDTAQSEKEHRRQLEKEQRDVLALLTPVQKQRFVELLGPSFPTERLGHASFQVPELTGADGWIQSPPLRIADLRGEVIALHFWTFG